MSFNNLIVPLDPREDKNGNIYYLGRLQAPMIMNFKNGAVFFAFLSEDGNEELHIGCARPNSQFSSIKKSLSKDRKVNRLHIGLDKKKDDNGNPYYVALVQDDMQEIDLSEGFLFLVFTSKEGSEQIQIVRNDRQQSSVEVSNRRTRSHHEDSGSYLLDDIAAHHRRDT